MALTQNDIDSILGDVRDEFDALSRSKRRQVTRNEYSLTKWLRKKLRQAVEAIGYYVSLPFRVIADVIDSFLDGFRGSDEDDD